MEEQQFNSNQLRACSLQYSISHQSVMHFRIGETVFLKSNPEYPMTVVDISDIKIFVISKNNDDVEYILDFPPQCLLQYRFAGLLTYKRQFQICLN